MNAISELDSILQRMCALLDGTRLDQWAYELEGLRLLLPVDPSHAIWKIGRLFGGAGSLNDLVLYRDGELMRAETEEFDALRTSLYQHCMLSRSL